MKRIGLSQRVEAVSGYGERRDCLDQKWTQLLSALGYMPVPLCNTVQNVDGYLDGLALSGAILTGGNDLSAVQGARDVAPERDHFETVLISFFMARRLPLLGICRGMQMLNVYFGGRLEHVSGHVACRHQVHIDSTPFPDWGTISEVNSFHNIAVPRDGLGTHLVPMAVAEDGTVESLRHKELPFYGIMWHPEREVPFRDRDQAAIRTIFGKMEP